MASRAYEETLRSLFLDLNEFFTTKNKELKQKIANRILEVEPDWAREAVETNSPPPLEILVKEFGPVYKSDLSQGVQEQRFVNQILREAGGTNFDGLVVLLEGHDPSPVLVRRMRQLQGYFNIPATNRRGNRALAVLSAMAENKSVLPKWAELGVNIGDGSFEDVIQGVADFFVEQVQEPTVEEVIRVFRDLVSAGMEGQLDAFIEDFFAAVRKSWQEGKRIRDFGFVLFKALQKKLKRLGIEIKPDAQAKAYWNKILASERPTVVRQVEAAAGGPARAVAGGEAAQPIVTAGGKEGKPRLPDIQLRRALFLDLNEFFTTKNERTKARLADQIKETAGEVLETPEIEKGKRVLPDWVRQAVDEGKPPPLDVIVREFGPVYRSDLSQGFQEQRFVNQILREAGGVNFNELVFLLKLGSDPSEFAKDMERVRGYFNIPATNRKGNPALAVLSAMADNKSVLPKWAELGVNIGDGSFEDVIQGVAEYFVREVKQPTVEEVIRVFRDLVSAGMEGQLDGITEDFLAAVRKSWTEKKRVRDFAPLLLNTLKEKMKGVGVEIKPDAQAKAYWNKVLATERPTVTRQVQAAEEAAQPTITAEGEMAGAQEQTGLSIQNILPDTARTAIPPELVFGDSYTIYTIYSHVTGIDPALAPPLEIAFDGDTTPTVPRLQA
ncbi:MAG: hypothetical protein D6820_12620, partial [Lentisphaerae bacterium]